MKRNTPDEKNVGPNPNASYEDQNNFTPPTTGTKKTKDHNQHAKDEKASPTSSNITSSDGKRKSVF